MIKAEDIRKINPKEFKYLTKNQDGSISVFERKPFTSSYGDFWDKRDCCSVSGNIGHIEVEEFASKDWKDCLIEFEPDYSDMIGCVGWFKDDCREFIDILVDVSDDEEEGKFKAQSGAYWQDFRPAKPDDLKFYEEK